MADATGFISGRAQTVESHVELHKFLNYFFLLGSRRSNRE